MKQAILIAALTVFLASLGNVANAQCFQFRICYDASTCGGYYQRPRIFPRLFGFYRCEYPCGAQSTTTEPSVQTEPVEPCPIEAPPCPSCEPDESCEYFPTEAGNVPCEVYRMRDALLKQVNSLRYRYGRSLLKFDANLEQGAIRQAGICSRSGSLIHARNTAEVLAMNSTDFKGAINQWLNSQPHLNLLLSQQFRFCGIGMIRDRSGRVWYSVQLR